MHRYLLKRLLVILPTMLLIFFAVYGLMLLLPATRSGGFRIVLQHMLAALTNTENASTGLLPVEAFLLKSLWLPPLLHN